MDLPGSKQRCLSSSDVTIPHEYDKKETHEVSPWWRWYPSPDLLFALLSAIVTCLRRAFALESAKIGSTDKKVARIELLGGMCETSEIP